MRTRLAVFIVALIVASLTLSACGGARVARSGLERLADPQVPAADSAALILGNTHFAFDLYQALRSGEGNLVWSPFSVSLALALTWAGARAETSSQMAGALHYTLPQEQLHPAFNRLDLDLASRPAQAAGVEDEDRFELSIANAIFGQQGFAFLPEYLDLLAVNYGAGLRLVDFQGATEAARRQVNDWVSEETRERIHDILPPNSVTPDTRLVLANAIYFKATWENEFDPVSTVQAPFTLLDGSRVDVEMMGMGAAEYFSYAAGEGWQAIALPYRGGLADMLIIVPESGGFMSFESSLDANRYLSIVSALQPQYVGLRLPKFTFETSLDLGGTLVDMGMVAAFEPGLADFSGMDGAYDLYIGKVLHKAFIAVDEKGTEAAAATVVVVPEASLPPPSIPLLIDRPFLYFIRDVPTGTILFMGRVLDPR